MGNAKVQVMHPSPARGVSDQDRCQAKDNKADVRRVNRNYAISQRSPHLKNSESTSRTDEIFIRSCPRRVLSKLKCTPIASRTSIIIRGAENWP